MASGADTSNVRSLKDEDAIYKAFDSYPWSKDETFQSGLHAILGPPSSTANPSDIATHARIFYYNQRIGVTIDFASYQDWLSRHPDHKQPEVLPAKEDSAELPSPALSWQTAAPKADLYIDRTKQQQQQQQQQNTSDSDEQPAYPMAFAEMIKLLQEGKEIPGIKQIPNTIARGPTVRPIGSRQVPRKPWEKVTPQQSSIGSNQALDTEFPPLDDDLLEPNTAEGVTSG